MRSLLLLCLQLLGRHLRLKMGLLPYRLVSLGLCDLWTDRVGKEEELPAVVDPSSPFFGFLAN